MATDDAHEDKRPASRRVADALQGRIDAGEFAPGAQLPTYRLLAEEYEVAVNTALAAVRLLRDSGVVTIRTNAGAYVREPSEQVDVAAELTRTRSELTELRKTVQQADAAINALEGRLDDLISRVRDE
ncbi:winged helix-turn-helix domain-containing protein [Saccharopolyspora sp. NPDC049357]|uniref:winged helix-turn-helix domain-containing protein n=1 Tax=Saccharopolyspora sp. NPDC049357 TaxID=3154507 RepID=UPI003440187C